jgi:CBS domain-containing protein
MLINSDKKGNVMEVKEIMTENIETANADQMTIEAAKMMKDLNVGTIPVKEDGNVAGIITDRDIVVRLLAEEKDPNSTPLKDVMTKELTCCSTDDDVENAIKIMEDKKLRRLIVCDQQKNPVGILSLGDVAVKSRRGKLAGEALETISKPAAPEK